MIGGSVRSRVLPAVVLLTPVAAVTLAGPARAQTTGEPDWTRSC
jgi:hypothetical protein